VDVTRRSGWKGLSEPVNGRTAGETDGEDPQEESNMLELFTKAQSFLASRLQREDGQALVEYALILALIAVVSITVLTLLGTGVSTQLSKIESAITNAG
jgi:pilus assembly protein Flp/PilA